MKHVARIAFVFLALLCLPRFDVRAGDLTFADRVACQEAIERVYYSHQVGTTRPFEEAVPREILETKVRKYLKQSVALEEFWQTPITAEALRGELQRIAAHTRFPDRLHELYAALGDDPVLVQECFARPFLVDRLTRNFFAFDGRFHSGAKTEAENLHGRLVRGELDVFSEHPDRSVARIASVREDESARLTRGQNAELSPSPGKPGRIELSSEDYQRWRSRAPKRVGEVGDLQEGREAFVIRVLLAEDDGETTIASYRIMKTSWDEWWASVRDRLNESVINSVAQKGVLPAPGANSAFVSPTLRTDGGVVEPENGSRQATSCRPGDTWDNGNVGIAINGRAKHTAVWTGNQMIIWGGGAFHNDAGDYIGVNTGGRYDPLTDTWTAMSSVDAPTGRFGHTAVWTGSLMIVWGGEPYDASNTGGRYDPVSDTWTPTSTVDAPTRRYWHTSVWTGSLMVIWGGEDGTRPFNPQTGGRYDPVTDTWQATSTIGAPDWRPEYPTAVWTGSLMIVWGGELLNTGARYDPVSDSWTPTSTVDAPRGRLRHTAVWTGSQMIVWGGRGRDGTYLDSGGRYDPLSDTWTPMSSIGAPVARERHTAVWTGSEMIVWGGQDYQDPYNWPSGGDLDIGGRYDPLSDTWMPTSTVGAPIARSEHTAVWTGSQMIVWGGYLFDTGGRYDPVSDTWTPTSRNESPQGRSDHSAVWTGNLMIVWGGRTNFSHNYFTYSGGRYDPLSDTWTPVSYQGLPPGIWILGAYGNSAIWTGSEMIIWGGDTYGSAFNTGARYDPISDTWMMTSTVGAPSARFDHTAVWTGSTMVVWGGVWDFGSQFLDTGGRYDPGNDTWTPTSTVGAPAARARHTAVWTDSRMVVWGGWGSGETLNSGGQYDPIADIWTPTSTVDAPAARHQSTAVWTGNTMVVWGGLGDYISTVLDTGGRYDPVNDTWMPTSTLGAPTGRSRHTVVWTGDWMVVWGGADTYYGSPGLDSGGRYDPVNDTWIPTSTLGAPEGRSGHTAVWTGSRMIVWGGAGWPDLKSGGRYDPGNAVDLDGDGYTECDGDCNNADPSVFPGAPEACDGLDNDCNGLVDDDAEGVDFDGDSVPNACDNCRFTFNPVQEDADGDGAGDACDNCWDIPNAGQSDVDNDQWGDVCDDCPTIGRSLQSDVDADGIGDVCDICIVVADPGQSDIDGDFEGDPCDLDDGFIWMSLLGPSLLSWQMEAGYSTFNLYRSDLEALMQTGEYTQDPLTVPLAAKLCDTPGSVTDDSLIPPLGKAVIYFVTGNDGFGVEGTLGTDGGGEVRPNSSPCP